MAARANALRSGAGMGDNKKDINLIGTQISTGGNLGLDATGDINILALETQNEYRDDSNSFGLSMDFGQLGDGVKQAFDGKNPKPPSWKDAVSDGFGSTNANNGGDDYNGSGTSYTRPNIDVGGTFTANGNDMNLEGAINAGNIDIDLIGDLNITTVLDTYKGDGDSLNFGGGKNSINIGWGDKDDDKAWANEDQIAGLYTDGSATINVDGTTSLTGGAIVADELNLTTGDLEVNDLEIYDESKDKEIAIGVNLNNFDKDDKNDSNSYGNVDYKNEGHDKEGEINSTIASNGGTITIGGNKVSKEELEELGVNTDLDNLHVITKDENWSIDLPVELINAGVAKDQIKDVTNAIKSITADVPDYVKANGKQAEDIYRRAIANGMTEEQLKSFAGSKEFDSLVRLRENIEKDYAEGKATPERIYSHLQNEMLAFSQDFYVKNCSSGPAPAGVCDKVAKYMNKERGELTRGDIVDMMETLEGLYIRTPEQLQWQKELLQAAVDCATEWSKSNKSPEIIKDVINHYDTPEAADDNLRYHGYDPVLTRSAVAYDDALKLYQSGEISKEEFNGRIEAIKQEVSNAKEFYGNNYRPEGSDDNLRMQNSDLKNYTNVIDNLNLAQNRLNDAKTPSGYYDDDIGGEIITQHSSSDLGNELGAITGSLFKDAQFVTDYNWNVRGQGLVRVVGGGAQVAGSVYIAAQTGGTTAYVMVVPATDGVNAFWLGLKEIGTGEHQGKTVLNQGFVGGCNAATGGNANCETYGDLAYNASMMAFDAAGANKALALRNTSALGKLPNTTHYIPDNNSVLYKTNEVGTIAGKTCVYNCVVDGTTRYVGITDDLARRGKEHWNAKGIEIEEIVGMSNLSRADARAVEQTLIHYYGLGKDGGTLLNKINSISPTKNPTAYEKSLIRGKELLDSVDYQWGK